MADNRHAEAVDIVARGLIADLANPDEIGDAWELVPEIGNQVFDAVCDRAVEIIVRLAPTVAERGAAYAFLEQRAGNAEAPDGR